MLRQQTRCEWVTLSEGTVIYGSEIVERVRQTHQYHQFSDPVQMIIAPVNHAKYLHQGMSQQKGAECLL